MSPSGQVSAFSDLADAVRGIGLIPRWILTGRNKVPLDVGWPDIYPSDDDARAHIADGGLVGIEPWSLKSAVGDVDRDGHLADFAIAEGFIQPWADTPTSRAGGRHLYAKTEEAERNGKWVCGDIRGARGCAIIHNPLDLAEQVENFGDAPIQGFEQVRLFGPPIAERPKGGRRKRKSDARAEPTKVQLVVSATSRSWNGAAMYEGTVGVGQRHDWMYRRLVCAPRGADIEALAAKFNRSRLEHPLPDADIRKTIRSAERSRRRMMAAKQLNRLQVERGRAGGRKSGEVRWAASTARAESIRLMKADRPELTHRQLADAFRCSPRTVWAALADRSAASQRSQYTR